MVARGGHGETAVPIGQKAGDLAAIGYSMPLYRAAAVAGVIFEPAAGGIEGIANRDMCILMRVVSAAVAADGNLGPGDGEIDADREQLALPMARILAFDDDMARRDPIKKLVELFRPLAYSRLKRGGGIHVAKGNLERRLHRISPADSQFILGCGAATAIDPAQLRRQHGRGQGDLPGSLLIDPYQFAARRRCAMLRKFDGVGR